MGSGMNEDSLEGATSIADIIVNTTSVGMGAGHNATVLPRRFLRRDVWVYDIVYNPLRTRLVSEAEEQGCTVVTGADMLAWQGALAFEKWTRQKAPVDVMKKELIRKLTHEN